MKIRPVALVLLTMAVACGSSARDEAACDGPAPRGPSTLDPSPAGLSPHLFAVRDAATGPEPLADGAPVTPGELVQVGYVAAGHAHGVIVSLDGGGRVTLHHPPALDAAPTLRPRGPHPLPHAFELDDAESFERFVLVTSGDERLDPGRVIAAAEEVARGQAAATAPLPLPWRWSQSSLLLRKPR